MSRREEREEIGRSDAPQVTNRGGVNGHHSLAWRSGLDWIELSCRAIFRQPDFDSLLLNLQTLQEKAREENADVGFDVDGLDAVVLRGSGSSSAMHWAVAFKVAGITFKLTTIADASNSNRPNLGIVIPSTPLTISGALDCWFVVSKVCRRFLGVLWAEHKLGRIDVCCDAPDADPSLFSPAIAAGAYVCRAKQRANWFNGQRLETLKLGAGDIQCRIYDKAVALRAKKEVEKSRAMCRRWGVTGMPKHAVRIEFQIRREVLRELKIDTFKDFHAKRRGLVDYLFQSWLRVCVPGTYDREHRSRSPTDPHWADAAYSAWEAFDGDDVTVTRDRAITPYREDRHTSQIKGHALRIAANRAEGESDPIDLMVQACGELIHELRTDDDKRAEAMRKFRRLIQRKNAEQPPGPARWDIFDQFNEGKIA